MRRLSRRIVVLAAAGVLAAGCLSPTLPLPPPSRPDTIEPIGSGQYRVTGSIPLPGTVLIQNQRTHLVFGKEVEALYAIDVGAQPGDYLLLWYQVGLDPSETVAFQIEESVVLPGPDAGARDAAAD